MPRRFLAGKRGLSNGTPTEEDLPLTPFEVQDFEFFKFWLKSSVVPAWSDR